MNANRNNRETISSSSIFRVGRVCMRRVGDDDDDDDGELKSA